MSTLPDNEFDLEKLFLPAWAQEEPSAAKYAKYEGEPDRAERRNERRGPRPPRRDSQPRGHRLGGPKERKTEPGSEGGFSRGGPSRGRFGPRRSLPPERREPPRPLPEIDVALVPEEKGVESLARQIKMTGRAYPLFDIAQMILQKPERHTAVFTVKKNAEGKVVQPLFLCALDDTLWLSEDEAVGHVLKKHFATFYQAERTPTEPPKGKYTFVAQCGISGVTLGPPNYHDYQNQLRKLHAERFSRMPFEVFKSRVKIVRDEEVVKKWVEEQSFKTEYICLNMPEPLRLSSMEAVEKHFRENHKDNIIKSVESHTLGGAPARGLRCSELARLVRTVADDQRRFPLQIATALSQQFATHALQFFKVNKTITHVCVARPHYLDLALIPVSEGVKCIVDFINANPKCTRRKLVEALAPTPPASAETAPAVEGQPAAPPQSTGPSPEQNAVISDLHWLIHQGHVIEFANGTLETAKKPVPKPPKPAAKPAATPSAEQTTEPIAEAANTAATPETQPVIDQASSPMPEQPQVDGSASAPTAVVLGTDSQETAPDLQPAGPPDFAQNENPTKTQPPQGEEAEPMPPEPAAHEAASNPASEQARETSAAPVASQP